MKTAYLYNRFERFWHWVQSGLIIMLALTGFEIHGVYQLFGFRTAHEIHIFCGWAWLVLYAFILFWLATTGEWKQYIPTTKRIYEVARYYLIGIFQGQAHPVPKTERIKHNPLQRLTYLLIAMFLLPIQMASGFVYYYYNSWPAWGWTNLSLALIAFLHAACALAILTFLVVHVYMTTTGHSVFGHIKAMITGWEAVAEEEGSASSAE
ncbi:MAG: cytochrome b/b6 domain-containing protein [Thermodesulfobacteriota bacterium]